MIEKLEVEEEEDIGGESENDYGDDDNNGEQLNKKQRNKRSLFGRGMRKEWRDNDTTTTIDERQLHRALPEMSNTLSNWTLHGQNMGSMLDNYRIQCRNMKKNNGMN